MSFDLEPAELLAAALTAMTLALPLTLVLAAAAISGPRRAWNGAGLAMGTGLLLGVGLAAAAVLSGALPSGAVSAGSALTAVDGMLGTGLLLVRLALLLGLLGAIAAAVLVIVLENGSTLSAIVGITACGLIGLGAPSAALPALAELTTSSLVLLAAVVIEAVALVVLVGAAVAAAGHGRALQYGVAAAGVVGAVLSLYGLLAGADLPVPALTGVLIAVLVALALGSIVGGVLETLRARRPARSSPRTTPS